jgi:hypothetical protein
MMKTIFYEMLAKKEWFAMADELCAQLRKTGTLQKKKG